MPQFQSINNGRWKSIEEALHATVQSSPDKSLTIHTGAFGVLTVNGVPLYLAPGNPNRMPIPKALYKVVKIQPSDTFMVVIGVNNHFTNRSEIENPANGYVICRDTCNTTKFLDCNQKGAIMDQGSSSEAQYIDAGYIYTCNVDDFVSALYQTYQIDLRDVLKVSRVDTKTTRPAKRRRPGQT